ncbi:MAG: hypothetical protein JNL01_03455 [Bdellovibrionales bacterium]|nr:hypothetical protein [Bdellovibrionales bacterium]
MKKLLIVLLGSSISTPSFAADFKLYGFVLPNYIVSDQAVDSFSQNNLSAYTAAANPLLAQSPQRPRSSFQIAQSRFGFEVQPDPAVQGLLEFDFIDFTKASATTSALPRVRRALIDWKTSENTKIQFGQDWDLFSPLGPHTFNYVGHYFESGDLGFMRQQVVVLHTVDVSEFGIALGLQAQNSKAPDSNTEIGNWPTLALRWKVAPKGSAVSQAGFSAIGTALLVDRNRNVRKGAFGLNSFFEMNLTSHWNWKTEAYAGRNLFNLGLLSLSFGDAIHDASEVGFFSTTRYGLNEKHFVFGGLGWAKIPNPSTMAAAYTGTAANALLGTTGPGIESNFTARLGYEYKPLPMLTWFLELAYLKTTHHYNAVDLAVSNRQAAAFITNSGLLLNF